MGLLSKSIGNDSCDEQVIAVSATYVASLKSLIQTIDRAEQSARSIVYEAASHPSMKYVASKTEGNRRYKVYL